MRSRLRLSCGVLCVALACVCASASRADAAMWCATPLVAHEWGVHLFDATGAPRAATLPAYFHTRGPHPSPSTDSARVADLPPDSGVRLLPVLHFYSPSKNQREYPLGIGVGFTAGSATAWFPQVDIWRDAAEANSPAAQIMRGALEKARAQLNAMGPRPKMPDDLSRQLQWSNLTLTTELANNLSAATTTEPWIIKARQFANALWVNRGNEAERFVFYEAATRERVALQIKRGTAAREYILENPTQYPVHDVMVVNRDGAKTWVAQAALIPAGGKVTVVLNESTPSQAKAAARTQWIDAKPIAADCKMDRDPAIPVEKTNDYHLFTEEVDLALSTWSNEIFEHAGTTIVYREDSAYLDQVMPLSLFTSMNHYVVLNRLGLAVWQNVTLP